MTHATISALRSYALDGMVAWLGCSDEDCLSLKTDYISAFATISGIADLVKGDDLDAFIAECDEYIAQTDNPLATEAVEDVLGHFGLL